MELKDYSNIWLNNAEYGAVHLGGEIIWPVNFVFSLEVVWTMGSSYAITAIPAAGGYATPVWTLKARRGGTVIYQSTVTPTTLNISDTTNFSYAWDNDLDSYAWKANNRGTNGYTTGTTSPTSAQLNTDARSCTLSASYVGQVTINGVTVDVDVSASTQTMTQNENDGTYYSSLNTFDTFSMYLEDFYDSAHEAKACAQQTSARASCRCGNYFLWDSGEHAYYYQTLDEASFSFSCPEPWITIDDNDIAADSRGKSSGSQRSATITGYINPSVYPHASGSTTATFYQKANSSHTVPASCSYLVIDSFVKDNVSINKINSCKQTTVSIVLKADWMEAGTAWTAYDDGDSSAITYGASHTNDTVQASSNLYVSGSDSTTRTSFTVTNKHNTSEETWYVWADYLDKEAFSTINQVADTYTTTTEVTNYVGISVTSGSISASGGSLVLSYFAKHTPTTVETWNSDGQEKSRTPGQDVDDTSRAENYISLSTSGPSGHSGRFSRSGSTLTHTTMANHEGTDKVSVTIVHPDQSSVTDSTGEYSAQNVKSFGTITLTPQSASSANANIAAYADGVEISAYCPVYWTSNYNDPGLDESDFVFTIQSYANSGYRSYALQDNTISFGSLAKNTRSAGSTVVKATHTESGHQDIYDTTTLTELRNKKGGGGESTVPGQKTYDTPYTSYDYGNFSLSVSLSDYDSSSSPAMAAGPTTYNNLLSWSCSGHRERTATPWERTDTVTYTWDSGAQDVETVTETGEDYGSWSSVPDTPSLTSNKSWLTLSGSGSTRNVTVGDNTGLARNATITASVTRGDTGTAITDTVTFYQAKFCSITASVGGLQLPAQGGTTTFTVSYVNTQFDISFTSPVYSVSPSSRQGSASSSGTVTYTVTWNTSSSDQAILGDITITPLEDVLADIEIGVEQAGRIEGIMQGFANCVWGATSGTVDYEWVVTNTGNINRSVNLTMYFCHTNSPSDNPDESGSGMVYTFIGAKTIPAASGGVPGEASGSGTRYLTRTAGLTYWARVTGTGVTTQWYQIEENPNI